MASARFAKNPDSLLVKAFVKARNLKPSLILLDTYAWRWGAKQYADMLDIAKDFTLDPAQITCPLLRHRREGIHPQRGQPEIPGRCDQKPTATPSRG